ncbi:hypothetical protein SAMN04487976_105314 [Xaviernesmea oryzae]|nr:hypothetical protein SAMN04487976_105314 [Xaviernesmea oryzae]
MSSTAKSPGKPILRTFRSLLVSVNIRSMRERGVRRSMRMGAKGLSVLSMKSVKITRKVLLVPIRRYASQRDVVLSVYV